MGAFDFSIDIDLVESLRRAIPLAVFVETGTFEGEAVARVLPLFDEIHSVELADEYYRAAAERFREEPKVNLHAGDSREVLARLSPELEERSVLYWLDAHWCAADGTAGTTSQCPLLGELEAIGSLNAESVVLIDDARLFLAPPAEPHEASQWPAFDDVLERLRKLSGSHEIMVVNDVIAFYPPATREAVSEYARARGVDLLALTHRLDELERELATQASAAAERLAALERLQQDDALLESVAAERLAVINDLSRVAEERLDEIAQLRRIADERLALLEGAQAPERARTDDL
jgi:hypothetical protein